MDRTTAGNNVDIGGGRRGYRDRDLAGGLAGTKLVAADRNALQESAMALVEGTGQQGNASNQGQQLIGLRRASGLNITSITASGTLTADNLGVLVVDATAGNVVVTLPAVTVLNPTLTSGASQSPAVGLNPTTGGSAPATTNAHAARLQIMRSDITANTVTVVPAGSDTIDGQTSLSLPPGGQATLVGNGVSSWRASGRRLRGRKVFVANGTITTPPGVYQYFARVWGDGGGSGACTGANSAGGAGASGGYDEGLVATYPGQTLSAVVGQGGAAGIVTGGTASGGGNGTGGSFGGISATGGHGGDAAAGGLASTIAAAGVGSGGDLNLSGGLPDQPLNLGGGVIVAAKGGAPIGAPGPHTGSNGASSAGIAGTAFGAGATGPVNAANGAVGGRGCVIVEWEYPA